MIFRIIAALVAVSLLLGFLVPYVVKMQDVALGIVALVGVAMMALDLWETFHEKDE